MKDFSFVGMWMLGGHFTHLIWEKEVEVNSGVELNFGVAFIKAFAQPRWAFLLIPVMCPFIEFLLSPFVLKMYIFFVHFCILK